MVKCGGLAGFSHCACLVWDCGPLGSEAGGAGRVAVFMAFTGVLEGSKAGNPAQVVVGRDTSPC